MRIIGLVYFVLCGLLIESALGLRASLHARDTEESQTLQISEISQYNPGAVRVEKQTVIRLRKPNEPIIHQAGKIEEKNKIVETVEKQAVIPLGNPNEPKKKKKKKKKVLCVD
eukprot:Platyproteum_vivax@DN11353_c0_g1_i1.p1